jgi:hypothetical protein
MLATTGSPAQDTPKRTVALKNSPEDEHPIDFARLLRLHGSLAALIAELHSIPEGSVGSGSL